MSRFLAVAMLSVSSVIGAQFSFADAKPAQNTTTQSASTLKSTSGVPPALPPIPKGKSTVIGGAIRDVDHVRDQFTLQVFGGRSMKILFDERTRLYRDGVRIPLRNLRTDAHASVETVLDGTNTFAISIHSLSQSPEGEYQGQVLNYNPATSELTVSAALSRDPIELHVPAGTPVVHLGQSASSSTNSNLSDLVKGTLVSIQFQSGDGGRGVAKQIAILATPGSDFVFSGNLTFLDLHSNTLVITDPRDGKSYKIFFDPARFPVSQKLHEGAHLRITAKFDGTRYVASAITIT